MNKIVLVIDDDPTIVHLLKEDLECEGYTVLEGYDGQAALELAKSRRPALIMMDLNMPVINGLQALEYLRATEETKTIPVIFLTGESSERTAPAAPETRVAYLRKPIDLDQLNAIVRKYIEAYPL